MGAAAYAGQFSTKCCIEQTSDIRIGRILNHNQKIRKRKNQKKNPKNG